MEKELLDKTWDMLEKWEAPTPSPDFNSKFWKKVDMLESRKRRIFRPLVWHLAPALISAFIIIATGIVFITSRIEHMKVARDIELYQDLEIIQNMDLLVDMEILMDDDEYES